MVKLGADLCMVSLIRGVLLRHLTIYDTSVNFEKSSCKLMEMKVDFIDNKRCITLHPNPLPLPEVFNFISDNVA